MLSMLRKTNPPSTAPLYLDRDRWAVYVRGQEVHTSPGEYRVLLALVDAGGQLLTHREVQEAYAGQPYGGIGREQLMGNARSAILRVRRVLEGSGHQVVGVWGRGFRLEGSK